MRGGYCREEEHNPKGRTTRQKKTPLSLTNTLTCGPIFGFFLSSSSLCLFVCVEGKGRLRHDQATSVFR